MNVILTGMPGSGKSTLGVLLAKTLGMTFLDTDLVIQEQAGALLRDLIADRGIEGFLDLEGEVCAHLQAHRTVVATGGSVVYRSQAMAHLRELGTVVYLKLGYRAKYIHAICQDAASGALDLDHLAALDYSGAMEYLTGFYGIGTKVANCICLFGLHHIEAFPVDTWIQKILMREYYDGRKYRKIPRSRLCETMVRDHFDTGCGGILQQYIFNYERNVRSRRD